MPKKKKKEVEEADVNDEATEVKEVKPKKEPYKLYAWFAYIDKEGFKVKSEHRSEGETVAELLTNLEFPAGVNRLVNVEVTHGDKGYNRALAPHTARAVLERKDVEEFNRLFRGV